MFITIEIERILRGKMIFPGRKGIVWPAMTLFAKNGVIMGQNNSIRAGECLKHPLKDPMLGIDSFKGFLV